VNAPHLHPLPLPLLLWLQTLAASFAFWRFLIGSLAIISNILDILVSDIALLRNSLKELFIETKEAKWYDSMKCLLIKGDLNRRFGSEIWKVCWVC
jgi:hypothetical protein